jgi:hypothetical protein
VALFFTLLAPRATLSPSEPAVLLTELAALLAPRVAELAALRALSVTEPPELLVLFAAELPVLRAPVVVEPELLGVLREPLLFFGVDFWGGIETSSREN